MITAIFVISYLIGAVTVLDEMRRPHSAWVAADRNRGWWITTSVIFGIAGCGLFMGIAYLVGVLPGLSQSGAVDPSFRKQP